MKYKTNFLSRRDKIGKKLVTSREGDRRSKERTTVKGKRKRIAVWYALVILSQPVPGRSLILISTVLAMRTPIFLLGEWADKKRELSKRNRNCTKESDSVILGI